MAKTANSAPAAKGSVKGKVVSSKAQAAKGKKPAPKKEVVELVKYDVPEIQGVEEFANKKAIAQFAAAQFKRPVNELWEEALTNFKDSKVKQFKTDLQILAMGGILRKECGKDQKKLEEARNHYAQILQSFYPQVVKDGKKSFPGNYKKFMAVAFPANEERFDPKAFTQIVDLMNDQEKGLSSAYAELYEKKGLKPARKDNAAGGSSLTPVSNSIVLPANDANVKFAIAMFPASKPAESILTLISRIKAAATHSGLTWEEVEAEFSKLVKKLAKSKAKVEELEDEIETEEATNEAEAVEDDEEISDDEETGDEEGEEEGEEGEEE